ncbi:Os01g0588300, partial [Oryza sativa Japonica Group]
MLTSDSEFALTSTVNFLFLSWVWSSPKTDSFFLVPAADTHDALGGAGGEGELVVRPVVPGAPYLWSSCRCRCRALAPWMPTASTA